MKSPFNRFARIDTGPELHPADNRDYAEPTPYQEEVEHLKVNRERMEARQAALKRPGDQPLRGYVGNTLNILNSTYDAYSAELAMLEKDIAKLNEDRRQLVIAMAGVVAALNDIKKENERSPAKIVIDEAALEADIAAGIAADENQS